MEEKKAKTLKLDQKESKQPEKLSYEQLEYAAQQITEQARALAMENQQLKSRLQVANMNNAYAELNFRFEVIKNANAFSKEFVERIVSEIEEAMTPQEEPEQKEEQDNKEQ